MPIKTTPPAAALPPPLTQGRLCAGARSGRFQATKGHPYAETYRLCVIPRARSARGNPQPQGNILSFNTYAYSPNVADLSNTQPARAVPYAYGDEQWGDLLTSLNGTTFNYDGMGNPANDETRSYTWQNGRQLASLTKEGTTWTYTYNNAGLRTARTNGTTTYKCVYNGSQLSRMTILTGADPETQTEEIVDFTYDASGKPLTLKYAGSTYYYMVNLQGDVVGIMDSTGTQIVDYAYTAYGQGFVRAGVVGQTADTLVRINPFLYRGYVLDMGTGLYYLQSRYYDPAVGRFINADTLVATGQGFSGNNMFAYCKNNPVKYGDFAGHDAVLLLDKDSYGHIGIIVQDDNGEWYHFYWGRATGSKAVVVGAGKRVPVNKQIYKIETSSDSISMKDVENAGVFSGHYDRSMYLAGDFSSCIEIMENYSGMYDVYDNNCAQVCFDILSQADTEYSEMFRCVADNYITPTKAYSFFGKLYRGQATVANAKEEREVRAIGYFWGKKAKEGFQR